MAGLKMIVVSLAMVAIVQARISQRESLNFLQQANTFDPENLNEPEGFYAPEEADLPNGDHQLIYSGPEGREACVVCQRSSPADDDTMNAIRRLKKELRSIKDIIGQQPDDDLPRSRRTPRGRKAPDQAEPDNQDQAPAPDQDQSPAPEPLLPEEQPAQILKDLGDVAPSDPALNDAITKVKDVLAKEAQSPEQPKTPEEAEKRVTELKAAKDNLEKLIVKENDPAKKKIMIRVVKRMKKYITRTTAFKNNLRTQKKIRPRKLHKTRDRTKDLKTPRTKTIKPRTGSRDLSKGKAIRAGSGSRDLSRSKTRRTAKAGSGSRDLTRSKTRRTAKAGSGSSDSSTRNTRSGSGSRDSSTKTTRSGDQTKSRTSSRTISTGSGSAAKDISQSNARTSSRSSEDRYETTEVVETVEYETREEYVK